MENLVTKVAPQQDKTKESLDTFLERIRALPETQLDQWLKKNPYYSKLILYLDRLIGQDRLTFYYSLNSEDSICEMAGHCHEIQLDDRDVQKNLTHLLSGLAGDEVELDTTKLNLDQVWPSVYWNFWKNGYIARVYRTSIYPLVAQIMNEIISQSSQVNSSITWADLFGGDGEFVELILQAQQGNTIMPRIYIVDRSYPSINIARARFSNYNEDGYSIICLEADLADIDPFEEIDVSFDICTAIGGFNREVITRAQALEILQRTLPNINSGAILIITGYTPCLLNSKDFLSYPLEILNMSIPSKIFSHIPPNQLYVLRKI